MSINYENYEIVEVNVLYPTEEKEEYEFVLRFEGEAVTRNFYVVVEKDLDYELVEALLDSQILDIVSALEADRDIINLFGDEEEW